MTLNYDHPRAGDEFAAVVGAGGAVVDATLHRASTKFKLYKAAQVPRGSLIDTRILRMAREHQLPVAISGKTVDRRRRVQELLHSAQQMDPAVSARDFGTCLALMFQPPTAHSYFVTAVAQNRDLWPRQETADVALVLQQDIARHRQPRVTASLEDVLTRLQTLQDHRMAVAVILMLVSASRHADLRQANMSHVWDQGQRGLAVQVDFPVWKSDRRGSKMAQKTIRWPTHLFAALVRTFRRFPTYEAMYEALQGVCTPHDLRRIAMSYLADHFTEKDVLTLTQHAAVTTASAHFRRYVKSTPHSVRARAQLTLSQRLWTALAEFEATGQLGC